MNALLHALTAWDRALFLAINRNLTCAPLDRIMPWLTDLGLGHVQVPVILGLALWMGWRAGELRGGAWRSFGQAIYRRRVWVGPLLVAFTLSGLASTALKDVPRERPWWYYNEFAFGDAEAFLAGGVGASWWLEECRHVVRPDPNVYVRIVPQEYPGKVRSFPSGHTTTSAALAAVTTLLYWRRRDRRFLVFGVWALAAMIGLSRIYLACHWPLDVFAGGLLGAVTSTLSISICRRYAAYRQRRRSQQTHLSQQSGESHATTTQS
jgi:membrane-associated phospholipid phosphatase